MWNLVIQMIISRIDEQIAEVRGYMRSAIEAANQAPSRMQSRYDSSREEFSIQAAAISSSLSNLEFTRSFLEDITKNIRQLEPNRICAGSLVHLRYEKQQTEYVFILPASGGSDVTTPFGEVILISVESPLGSTLMNHHREDKITFSIGGSKTIIEILAIWNGDNDNEK